MLHQFSILTLLSSEVVGIGQSELQSSVMLHLAYYNDDIELLQIFWGLWLFPFGYLVYKSGILPKVFGVLLMAGCFGYLMGFVGHFMFATSFDDSLLKTLIGIPASVGEIGICLWLLIAGVRDKALPQ